jgi:1-deoxy-D-xylulose-5-phosphate reductoisomerase
MKTVVVLGSTGSIGTATLDVIERQKEEFEVIGLACKGNVRLFNSQVNKYKPKFACIYGAEHLDDVVFGDAKRLSGPDGLKEIASLGADIVVNALPGSVGLEATLAALKHSPLLALANKESLVMAGRIIARSAETGNCRLVPIDSEHSALYQLLQHVGNGGFRKLMITASGGPFRHHSAEQLAGVTVEEALQHPTWNMGRKITLDCATLVNKGLEVIEARWLFGVEPERIEVLIHPESIVHGLLELQDGAILSYMAFPDMRIPISYALNGGLRHEASFNTCDLLAVGTLTFLRPDSERFPGLRLAYEALQSGDSALIVFNCANEIAVSAFLERRIGFTDISRLINEALANHSCIPIIEDVDTVWEVHEWTEQYVKSSLKGVTCST